MAIEYVIEIYSAYVELIFVCKYFPCELRSRDPFSERAILILPYGAWSPLDIDVHLSYAIFIVEIIGDTKSTTHRSVTMSVVNFTDCSTAPTGQLTKHEQPSTT